MAVVWAIGLAEQHDVGGRLGLFRVAGRAFAAGLGHQAASKARADGRQPRGQTGSQNGGPRGRRGPSRKIRVEQDERDDQCEGGGRLANGRADDHVGVESAGHGRLPGDTRAGGSGRVARSDARSQRSEAHAQAGGQRGNDRDGRNRRMLGEQQDEGDHQGENGGGFGDGLPHQHGFEDLPGQFGPTAGGQGGLGCGVALADGRPDGADPDADAGSRICGHRDE